MKVRRKSNKSNWRHVVSHAATAAGHAYGAYRSHTRTKTKSYTERLKGDDVHSGVTNCSYTIEVAKPKKSADYKAAKNMYQETTGGRYVGLAGLQACNQLTTVGTVKEWVINGSAANNHFGTSTLQSCLFAQNPSQFLTGSDQIGDAAGKRYANDMFYLGSCNVKISMANLSTLPCTTWLYVCVSKVDHNKGPNDDWDQQDGIDGLLQGAAGFPAAGSQVGGNSGSTGRGYAGNTPLSNANFRRLWAVKKVHRVNLAGAAQEDVDFHLKMNQLGNLGKFIAVNPGFTGASGSWTDANVNGANYVRGSVAIMVVSRGAVIHDKTGEAGDAVTFGATNVAFVCDKHYTCYPVTAKSNRMESKSIYPQIPFNVAIADSKFIDILDNVANVEMA